MLLKKNKLLIGKVHVIPLIVFFVAIIIPFFLSRSTNLKVQFFGLTILSSSIVIFVFIIGMCAIIMHSKKENSLLQIVKLKFFGAAFLFISIYLGMNYSLNYYKDVPKIINSDYSSYEGQLTKFYVKYGRATSTNFTIGNKEFKVLGIFTNPLSIGKVYQVKFLPNSEFVMSIKTTKVTDTNLNIFFKYPIIQKWIYHLYLLNNFL